MLDKTPPNFIEGEKAILGACLVDNRAILKIQRLLDATSFYSSSHRTIFEAMVELATDKIPIDFSTLEAKLLELKALDRVGGRDYIHDLLDHCPSAANVIHYAEFVRDKSISRNIISQLQDIISSCSDGRTDLNEIREQLHKAAFNVNTDPDMKKGLVHAKEFIKPALELMEQGHNKGLPSGLLSIDQFTRGFRPGQLVILGGRPSMGKSAMAADMTSAASRKTAVAFFSLEMSGEELITRFVAKGSQLDLHSLRAGYVPRDAWAPIQESIGEIADFPVFFDDSGTISVAQIRTRVQEVSSRTGIKFGMIVVDYLQLLQGGAKYNSQNEKISAITRNLKRMARDLDTIVVCLSQLNRQLEQRPFKGHERRPRMSDFRDSGSIEQDADIIIGLYRPEVYDEDPRFRGKAEAIILKHRNGPTGIAKLIWQPRIATFRDPVQEDDRGIMGEM